ncbi:unnamed protein product [Prorocentrum cordatum]|uniref:RNA helicase n=1 Tax=Prorocentrum cordatum TaxID=2364126 RepID=A0ABN9V416_9DINO|nr:unnamed protein product [Polarella glacialis]
MLDVHGLEVVNLGVATPFFSHDPNRPIREVVILLGGPSGIDKKALEQLQGVLNDKDGGLDGGTFAIKLPGGKQHSCVALGELLALHDGGRLLPMLEDWRLLGTARYGDWVRRAREALCGVAGARRGAAAKTRAVEAWRGRALRSAGSPVPGLERAAPAALPAAREATPAEVWRRVALLEQQGLLPHRRSWRLRMSLQAAPPHLAIAELARFEHTARAAASCGAPLEDPSVDLAELLDSLAQSAPREERARHTERAVLEALAARSGRGVRAADHRALGRLPCSRALRLLEELEGGPLEGRIPAAVEEHLAALEALDDWEAQGGGAPRQRAEDGGASSEAAEAEEEEGESHGWRSGQPDAPAAEGPQQPCMPPPQRLLRERGGGRGWQQGGRQPWKQQRRG